MIGADAWLGLHSAALVEVVDCNFDVDLQIAALTRLAREPVDAVISIPIGNARVAAAHRARASAQRHDGACLVPAASCVRRMDGKWWEIRDLNP